MKNILIIVLLVPLAAFADVIETWKCTDKFSSSGKILVIAKVNTGRKTGAIHVAGVEHKALFRIAGFAREWYFGPKTIRKTHSYTFELRPNGDAYYYDFSHKEETTPLIIMSCTQ